MEDKQTTYRRLMLSPMIHIIAIFTLMYPFLTNAAISLQQSRVIFEGDKLSASLIVNNQNNTLPYLAQGWIEDEAGKRILGPLVLLPPIQRIEPGAQTQIKIQALPAVNLLRQDRETLFYLNLREIPPRNEGNNTLQIALQNRIKIFYRPVSLKNRNDDLTSSWQSELVLSKQDNRWKITNPSAYYITLVDAQTRQNGIPVSDFTPFMLAPGASEILPGDADDYGKEPVFTYLNDYGGRPEVTFKCDLQRCTVIKNQIPKG